MSSPAIGVNRIRTIPLIVERNFNPMEMETEEITGYPFDDTDGGIHSQLDDLAKRHPELAGHLGSFRQRSNSRPNTTADDREFRGRFGRPFADHFERFGFPFDREEFDIDPERYAQQFYKPREEFFQERPSHNGSTSSYEEQPAYHRQEQQPAYQQTEPQYQQPQSTTQTSGKERSNLQQSNTTDLGQRQEPVNDRNQRSMSAPPGDKGLNFTSTQPPPNTENMSQPETKSNERIIPIHIEGRDEPVMPKNIPPTYSQPHHQQTYGSPQNERIFGQRPEHFTQFLHRGEPRQYDNWAGFAEEPIRQQRFQQQHAAPPHYAAPPKEEIPIPVHKVHQPRHPEPEQQPTRTASPHPPQPQQRQQTPPPKPAPQQPKSLSPIEQIQAIQKEVSDLMGRVEKFTGKPKDKEYLYLDEMLTRNLLKLDNIDTQGQENIRSARKEAVRCIEKTISVLEAKAAASVAPPKTEETMEVEEKPQATEAKETESEPKTEQTIEAQPIEEQKTEQPAMTEQQPMETDNEPKNSTETTETMELVPDSPANLKNQPESQEHAVQPENNVDTTEQTSESNKLETCEGQESNMSVADAVKKFGGLHQEKPDESTDVSAATNEDKKDELSEPQTEDKKEKKKGKKKVDKKDK